MVDSRWFHLRQILDFKNFDGLALAFMDLI